MLQLYRTYRFFPALAAALLLLGTGAPMVGYVCGETSDVGATKIVANAEASSPDGCETFLGCLAAPKEVPVEPSVPTAPGLIGSGERCCNAEAPEQAFVRIAPNISWSTSLLPILASPEAKQLPRIPFPLPSLSDRGSDAIFSARVSVRLVTSVFML